MHLILIVFVCITDVDVFDNRNCDNMSDCDHENVFDCLFKINLTIVHQMVG